MRLWPLLGLPPLGLAAGLLIAMNRGPGLSPTATELAVSGLYGLVAASALMSALALGVLAFRLRRRQFTIRALLIAIAVLAVLLGLVRSF